MRGIPEEFVDFVQAEREALWLLVSRARAAGESGAVPALREIAGEIRRRIARGDDLAIGNLEPHLDDITAQLDLIFDTAFPPPDTGRLDFTALLDTPWPTARRRAVLAGFLGHEVRHRAALDEVADLAVETADLTLARALVFTPLGRSSRATTGRILRLLHHAGQFDAAVAEQSFHDDRYLGHLLADRPADGFAEALRDHADALTWRLVTADTPATWSELPNGLVPRGLRFVLLALDRIADPQIAGHLGAAELTHGEQEELVGLLRGRSTTEQQLVYGWRGPDATAFLPVFGLERAAPLLRLIRAMPSHEAFRVDLAAVLAAITEAGVPTTRRLLELEPNELISAVLGDNRAAVLKRLRNNALQGIAAFGLLPLPPAAAEPAETVLGRYLAIREVARRGARFGPGRRLSHAAAIEVALDHLAQVAGFADAGRLEWDCEARLAEQAPTEVRAGDYRVRLHFDGSEPMITVERGGRRLKSVPATVRADPAYKQLREHQDRLRDQARRMRTGLIEGLVATGGTVTSDELGRLLTLPAGAAMLPALLWRDTAGTVGLLDDVGTDGPVAAVHPVELYAAGTLTDWQSTVVRCGREQPVKQVFREIYVPAEAERQSVESARFDGRVIDGRVAGQMLSARGWSIHSPYDDHQVTRAAGDLVAALTCAFHGYFGMGEVVVGTLRFLRDGTGVPLSEVTPVVFSEVIRDLDLLVSAAPGRT
ncbi:MAG TPA: DUF4132 domain-containing protein [Actinoplanes sp.]|nr:DUF4132 domain-containing protein [Actinoplanes sp.]